MFQSELLPTDASPRSGYTLPVFACAAAIAALRRLKDHGSSLNSVTVDLLEPLQTVEIPVEQVALVHANSALAITRSDPGDNLDLTKNTPIWAWVELRQLKAIADHNSTERITFIAGEGLGRIVQANHQPAIYAYARRLLKENLAIWLEPEEHLQVTFILPEGKTLAERTSNAAFGVVDGLALLGTSGIAQPLSAPGQLELYRQELRQKAERSATLVFCVGENGLELANRMGIAVDRLVKTANWLGPMLVEAGILKVQSILLFGYHGKLLKLAGGIFHTHHHVADGRQEILTAYAAQQNLPQEHLQLLLSSPTADAALKSLRQLDETTGGDWVNQIYGSIAYQIDQRTQAYIHNHSGQAVRVGSILFDRDRQIVIKSEIGDTILSQDLLT